MGFIFSSWCWVSQLIVLTRSLIARHWQRHYSNPFMKSLFVLTWAWGQCYCQEDKAFKESQQGPPWRIRPSFAVERYGCNRRLPKITPPWLSGNTSMSPTVSELNLNIMFLILGNSNHEEQVFLVLLLTSQFMRAVLSPCPYLESQPGLIHPQTWGGKRILSHH